MLPNSWLRDLGSSGTCICHGGLERLSEAQIPAPDHRRDVSSVEVLMNYHQGLKTELEARVPELTACQELGRSLLLNKSAMADEVGRGAGVPLCHLCPLGQEPPLTPLLPTHHSQIQAQLDKLGTRKEEVSEKWDRHWEWLQQSEWGPECMGFKGTEIGMFGKAQRVTQHALYTTHGCPAANTMAWGAAVDKRTVLPLNLWWWTPRGEAGALRNTPSPSPSCRAQSGQGWDTGSGRVWRGRGGGPTGAPFTLTPNVSPQCWKCTNLPRRQWWPMPG